MTIATDLLIEHAGMTRMLFVDAIVGVGFPTYEAGIAAHNNGMATFSGNLAGKGWLWDRSALDALELNTLMDLYTSLKMREIRHAG